LWDVLGEGEVCDIADYAAAHFREHKRPLRIAVDEACWRFRNLSPEDVESIRKGEPAANPVEKTILQQILRAYKLNIQLLFVWDGLRKPGKDRQKKKGPGGGKVANETVRSLHKLFDVLGVPYHQAPGEAETECAKLQRLGVVDAVWSDDGDSFMFGCTTLIRKHGTDSGNCMRMVRIYRSSTILERFDMDSDSLVLFAVLSGGDYDLTGLRDCGPMTAKEVAKRRHSLASALKHYTEGDLPVWRTSLREVLKKCGKAISVPDQFPKWKTVQSYRNPAVSTEEKCWNLSKLHGRGGWDQRIDEQKLRRELRERYNFGTREYLKHIAPLFLARALREATPQQKQENLRYAIQLKRTPAKKNAQGEVQPPSSAANFWYAPQALVDINPSVQPPEEDWTKYVTKDKPTYDPMERIDCERFLLCFLQNGLPEGALDRPATAAKKRKNAEKDADDAVPSGSSQDPRADGPSPKRAKKAANSDEHHKPTRPNKKRAYMEPPPAVAPPPQFRRVELPEFRSPVRDQASDSRVIDLCESSNSEGDGETEEASGLFVTPIPTPQPSQQSTATGSAGRSPARAGPKFRPLKPRNSLKSPSQLQKQPQSSTSTVKPKARRTSKPQGDSREKLSDIVSSTSVRVRKPLPSEELDIVSKARKAPQRSAQKDLARPPALAPGETIPAATLRELRGAMFATAASNVAPSPVQNLQPKVFPNNTMYGLVGTHSILLLTGAVWASCNFLASAQSRQAPCCRDIIWSHHCARYASINMMSQHCQVTGVYLKWRTAAKRPLLVPHGNELQQRQPARYGASNKCYEINAYLRYRPINSRADEAFVYQFHLQPRIAIRVTGVRALDACAVPSFIISSPVSALFPLSTLLRHSTFQSVVTTQPFSNRYRISTRLSRYQRSLYQVSNTANMKSYAIILSGLAAMACAQDDSSSSVDAILASVSAQVASISAQVESAAAAATSNASLNPDQLASYNSAAYSAATAAMGKESSIIAAALTSVYAAQSSASEALASANSELSTATGAVASSLSGVRSSITQAIASQSNAAATLSQTASNAMSSASEAASSASESATGTSSAFAAPTSAPLIAAGAIGAIGLAVVGML
ncbi:DNA repair protein RAD2, partial [Pseudocercospora fuligena]